MNKYLPLMLTVTLALGACSSPTATKEPEKKEAASEQDKAEKKPKEDKVAEKKEESQPPFKPLEPAKDAVSLKESLAEETPAEETETDQEGQKEKPQRTVPLGETLANGVEDPSDGPLKNHRLITYYGTPASKHMGILGKYEPEEYIKKLKEQTQVYSDLDPDRPAVPTIELITTMAQNAPGPDGDYVQMTSEENIETYVKLAEKHDALVLLDIQLGTDTVMNQVKMVEKWLKRPNVHLAIDTEFHVAEGEKPGEDLGEVDGRDIQEAIEYIGAMAEENNLPDKLVLVHQFTGPVLTNKDAIKPTENVEVAINFDGWGAAADKKALYGRYVRDEPTQYGAFKVFYEKDFPVLTPEEVLKMDPSPAVVNYQ